MERGQVSIEVEAVVIDEAKMAYIETKGVSYFDVLEVFDNEPRFFVTPGPRGPRYSMLGPNLKGRYLLTPIEQVEGSTWRVVTTYWLRQDRGRRLYEED